MLQGFLLFLLLCAVVSFVSSLGGSFNILGSFLALIEWIGNLPTLWGIVVCLAPFVVAFVLSQIIKRHKKK